MINMENKNKKNEDAGLSNYVFGKLPPSSVELEEAVLGAMMLEKDGFLVAISILRAEMFYVEANQSIFEAMLKLFGKNRPIDLLTVVDQLRNDGKIDEIGGALTITELTNRVTSTANIEFHCRIIYQKYLGRELIKIGNRAIKDGFDDTKDILEVIDEISRTVLLLSNVESTPNTEPVNRMMNVMNTIEKAMVSGKTLTGVPCGYRDIDIITGGWQDEDLIVIAGRPGMAKSAVALNFATNAAEQGFPTYFFSLEMSDTQLALREIASKTNIKYSKLRKGEIDQVELASVAKQAEFISNIPLYVDSTPSLNITTLRAKIMKAIHEKNIKLVVIDYLSYLENDSKFKGQSTADSITETIKELKKIARQFKLPIILLSQLNREVEKEASKRPQLHHLKSSGGIEEGADLVMLLYRPSYYDEKAKDQYNNSEENSLYVDMAKHKQGATGEVKLWVDIGKNIIKDWNGHDSGITNYKPRNSNDPF